jgi:hypothetical protein
MSDSGNTRENLSEPILNDTQNSYERFSRFSIATMHRSNRGTEASRSAVSITALAEISAATISAG